MLVRAAVRLGDGGLCRLPTMRTEKVDRGDLVQAFAQAAHIRRRDILALTQRARLACQLLIVGVTRSVIVNALRKLESAGLIESRSLGMKGTYIKVLSSLFVEELGVATSSRVTY